MVSIEDLPDYTVESRKSWLIKVCSMFNQVKNIDEKTKYDLVLNKIVKIVDSLPEFIQTGILSLISNDFTTGNYEKLINVLRIDKPPPWIENTTNVHPSIFSMERSGDSTNHDVHSRELLNIICKVGEEFNCSNLMRLQKDGGGDGIDIGALVNSYGASNGFTRNDDSEDEKDFLFSSKGRSHSLDSASALAAQNVTNITIGRIERTILDEVEHICIISNSNNFDDALLTKQFEDFCVRHRPELEQAAISRMTFVVGNRYRFSPYFTFRYQNNLVKKPINRHLDPALAVPLEINRLKNFDLEVVDVATASKYKMYLYLGKEKLQMPGQTVTDFRFFVRTIIHNSDLITEEDSREFLQSEGMV